LKEGTLYRAGKQYTLFSLVQWIAPTSYSAIRRKRYLLQKNFCRCSFIFSAKRTSGRIAIYLPLRLRFGLELRRVLFP
jgi:hypothetical protein